MFHSGTQRFLHVWSSLPDAGRIPLRRNLRPEDLGVLLNQAFLADRRSDAPMTTLASGWVERLHGGDLLHRPWLSLWRDEDRPRIQSALFHLFREARPVVMTADTGLMQGRVEIALAPLRGPHGAADRLIGLYQPLETDGRDLKGAARLGLDGLVMAGEPRRAPLTLAASHGRRVA